MDRRSFGETITTVVLWLAVAGGVAYGWFVVGTVWAALGGAALLGVFALVIVTVLAFVVAGVTALFKRARDR